jgi:hypothetical protein
MVGSFSTALLECGSQEDNPCGQRHSERGYLLLLWRVAPVSLHFIAPDISLLCLQAGS